jgi:hypothetical protein
MTKTSKYQGINTVKMIKCQGINLPLRGTTLALPDKAAGLANIPRIGLGFEI